MPINLKFKKSWKSIRSLNEVELPDFVVLTGVNGAGKSHLLEAIEAGAVEIEGIPSLLQNSPRLIRRFDANSLVTQDTGAFSNAQMMQEVGGQWDQLQSLWKQQLESAFQDRIRQHFPERILTLSLNELHQLTPEQVESYGAQGTVGGSYETLQTIIREFEQYLVNVFIQQDPSNRPRVVKGLQNQSNNFPLVALSQQQFYHFFPRNWQQTDIFQQSFSRVFTNYQAEWRDNELRARGKEKGEDLTSLSADDFTEKYGQPPWEFLNNLLELAGLDFRINSPSRYENLPYEPNLLDIKRGITVKFADLSSGERIIMSFALCLYHVKDQRATLEYPKILLFDEIDAPLHPSMTSSLLRTIQQALVNEKGIKVILTTHSPSTVALSPEESIYVMRKDGEKRLQSVSRDSALGILTEGVPTLSVNYENRRQVFVESLYDVSFYGDFYQLAKPKLEPEISISFISSGPGAKHGNCDQVISISKILRDYGNRTVIGLIDWDTTNKATEYVKVLGEGDRYAIDNYILDPFAIGLFILREQFSSPKDFGFSEEVSYLTIAQLSMSELEQMANNVVCRIAANLEAVEMEDHSIFPFVYAEGNTVNFPRWLSVLKGHRLEEVVKKTFPQLNKYQKEDALKNEILSKVFKDRPDFISISVVEVLRSIQKI